MYYTADLNEFFKTNLDDIRKIIRHLSYPRLLKETDLQEQVSAFYLYCHRSKLLDRYDSTKGPISSYIFRGIRFSLMNNQRYDTHHYVEITECTISYQIHPFQIDLDSFIQTLEEDEVLFIRDILKGLSNLELSYKYKCTVQNIYSRRWKLRDKWKAFSK